MPPALTRVEEASVLLIEASDMLRTDPFSAAARKKLIEGSRGITVCSSPFQGHLSEDSLGHLCLLASH